MLSPTFLLVFLLINVFLIGMLSAVAIRHAYAHFKPSHHEPEKPHATAQVVHLPPAVRERLLQAAQTNFETVLSKSASELQRDLQMTSSQLNKQLEKLGNDIVSDEMKRYHASLEELLAHAETTISSATKDVASHQAELQAKLTSRQAELEAKLAEDIENEKIRLTQQIDTKLADAVASFLIETLQHNIDLGAQSTYLTAMLDEHKADIVQGISDEI